MNGWQKLDNWCSPVPWLDVRDQDAAAAAGQIKRIKAFLTTSLPQAPSPAMKLLLLSLTLIASIAIAAPGMKPGEVVSLAASRQRRQAEGGEVDCEGNHCFHGQHYWNLGEYHQERKRREAGEPTSQERSRRQAEDRPWIPEDQKCEDGTPHCFHGWHIFNVQPYHIEKRSVQLE